MRNRKIASAVIGIVAIGVISGLAGCGSTPGRQHQHQRDGEADAGQADAR